MANIDDAQVYKRLDPSNMREHLHDLPQQCRTAWYKARGFDLPKDYADIDKVVILGMGGSAIGGDLVRSLLLSKGKPIIFVNREYNLPAFVDEKTLVIASSYSGNTEETLSAFSLALRSTCKKLAMTTDGGLKTMAENAGVPVFHIDIVSQPRAALGYSFIPLIAFLQKLSCIGDKSGEAEAMIKVLEKLLGELKETVSTGSNWAKELATKMRNRIAVIYGAGIISQVARRWKTQINENSKSWAFYEIFSELNHNAVVGYQFPQELYSKIFVILLRCPSLHPRILARYQITNDLLEQNAISHQIVDSQGDSRLSQMMSLVYLGDWVSYYQAILNETDPTPVKAIDYLKKRLNEQKQAPKE